MTFLEAAHWVVALGIPVAGFALLGLIVDAMARGDGGEADAPGKTSGPAL